MLLLDAILENAELIVREDRPTRLPRASFTVTGTTTSSGRECVIVTARWSGSEVAGRCCGCDREAAVAALAALRA